MFIVKKPFVCDKIVQRKGDLKTKGETCTRILPFRQTSDAHVRYSGVTNYRISKHFQVKKSYFSENFVISCDVKREHVEAMCQRR